jgi:hypothetical protein
VVRKTQEIDRLSLLLSTSNSVYRSVAFDERDAERVRKDLIESPTSDVAGAFGPLSVGTTGYRGRDAKDGRTKAGQTAGDRPPDAPDLHSLGPT